MDPHTNSHNFDEKNGMYRVQCAERAYEFASSKEAMQVVLDQPKCHPVLLFDPTGKLVLTRGEWSGRAIGLTIFL